MKVPKIKDTKGAANAPEPIADSLLLVGLACSVMDWRGNATRYRRLFKPVVRLTLLALAFLAFGVSVNVSDAATLYNVANVDLSTTFNSTTGNGANPGAMAWDGSSLYVAGFNNSGAAANVGIVQVTNVLTSPVVGTPFGTIASMPAARGYVSADVRSGNVVFAADTGTLATSSISSYLTSTLALNFSKAPAGRPHVVGIDPIAGTGGVTNVNSLVQGSGSMRRDNVFTGVADTNIAITSGSGTSTAWRDLDFNDANGDAWMRVNNDVTLATRSGPGSFNPGALIVNLTDSNQAGESVAYLNMFPGGDFLVYNNRASTAVGQAFNTVVLAADNAGTPVTLDLRDSTGANAFTAPTGAAWYDFSWDSTSKTLAILDFSNRAAYVFSTVPEPNAIGMLVAGGLLSLRLRRRSVL